MAGAAGAAAAAIAQATKASGAIVKMVPEEFQKIINKSEESVVVAAIGGVFSKKYQYLTSYRGLYFFTSSEMPLSFPSRAELVTADKIWIP